MSGTWTSLEFNLRRMFRQFSGADNDTEGRKRPVLGLIIECLKTEETCPLLLFRTVLQVAPVSTQQKEMRVRRESLLPKRLPATYPNQANGLSSKLSLSWYTRLTNFE